MPGRAAAAVPVTPGRRLGYGAQARESTTGSQDEDMSAHPRVSPPVYPTSGRASSAHPSTAFNSYPIVRDEGNERESAMWRSFTDDEDTVVSRSIR